MENENLANQTVSPAVAIWTLVLGIMSIVCGGGICGIISIILYLVNKNKFADQDKGKATAGLVCAIIGLVVGAIILVLYFTILGASLSSYISKAQAYSVYS